MIQNFEDFVGVPIGVLRRRYFVKNQIDSEINDIIDESYGVSGDVVKMCDELVDVIKDSIEDHDLERIEITPNYNIPEEFKIGYEGYFVSSSCVIKNISFDIDCVFMNYGNIKDEDIEMLSTIGTDAVIKQLSPNRFRLECIIPIKNFDFNKIIMGILNHELMHAWQHHNKNTGKKEKEYPQWKTLYHTAIDVVQNKEKYSKDEYCVAKAIYYSDLRELAAFTQQAYFDIKDIDDGSGRIIDKEIRKSGLYRGANDIKSGIEYLENHELPSLFDISKSVLLKILKRRYYQYKKNISRLIVMMKEIIFENQTFFDSCLKDWLFLFIL